MHTSFGSVRFLEKVSYTRHRQGCIYLIKNTAKVLQNIITIENMC